MSAYSNARPIRDMIGAQLKATSRSRTWRSGSTGGLTPDKEGLMPQYTRNIPWPDCLPDDDLYVRTSGGNRRRRTKITPRLRARIRERDNETCQECGYNERAWELQIDHIVPYRDGGPTVADNLRLLCLACHNAKTAADNAARRERA